MGLNVRRRLYERASLTTELCETKTWSMAVEERKRLNIMEMRCLMSICGLVLMVQMKNEVMRRRTGVTRGLAS